MKKRTLITLSILGALALPVMGLAQLDTTSTAFANKSKAEVQVKYWQFTDATPSSNAITMCGPSDTIPANTTQILYGGATAGGQPAGCGITANITAEQIQLPESNNDNDTKWIVCTGANVSRKEVTDMIPGNTITYNDIDTLPVVAQAIGIPTPASCNDSTSCNALAQKCADYT